MLKKTINNIIYLTNRFVSPIVRLIVSINNTITSKTKIISLCILFVVVFSKIHIFLPTDKYDLNFRYELYDISKLLTLLFAFCWIYFSENWDVKNLPSKIFSFFFILECLKEISDRIIDCNVYDPVGDIFQSILMLLSIVFVTYCFMIRDMSQNLLTSKDGYFMVIKKPKYWIVKLFATLGIAHGSIGMIKIENGEMFMYSYFNNMFDKKKVSFSNIEKYMVSSFKIDDRLINNYEKLDLYLNNFIGCRWSFKNNCVFIFKGAIYSLGIKKKFLDFIPLYFFKRISVC